jgi:hypothetical protein
MPGSVLRSERFVISVEYGTLRRKVFQCQFARDGSIFVNFPYFKHSQGLVSLVAWPGGQGSTALSLEPGGRVSSHLVKYSHHPSGRAHFSQDGKILTLIKKDAVPLAELEGHLFTLHVHGLNAFAPLSDEELNEPPLAKKTGVRFTLGTECPPSGKFVGMLHRDTSLERRALDGMVHPVMQFQRADGSTLTGLICSQVLGRPGQERCLLIYWEPVPLFDQSQESSMLFIGGFDSGDAMNDVERDVSFLAFSYPVQNVEDLRRRLGSLDLKPPHIV